MTPPLRVLHVDDSEWDRTLVQHALANCGREIVLTAVASCEAFEHLLTPRAFDVVLADYHLPGHDALDVLRIAQQRDPAVPVIVVTGTGSEATAVAAMKHGAADYVLKTPSHLQRLLPSIESALHERALRETCARTQAALEQAMRMCMLKSACSEAVVRADSEDELFGRMCAALVETGGYRAAWIATAAPALGGSLQLAAHAGLGYRDAVLAVANPQGPAVAVLATGCSVRAGTAAYTRTDACGRPCSRDDHTGAVLALPLSERGSVGVLTVEDRDQRGFDDPHVEALERIAADMTYGVQALRTRAARRAAEERLETIVASIDSVVWSAGERDLIYMSAGAERVLGRAAAAFLHDPELWREVVHADDHSALREALRRRESRGVGRIEHRVMRPDGDLVWVESRVQHVHDADGRWLRMDGISVDISERKRQESRIEHLVNHDALTGLPNRIRLADRFAQAAVVARRDGRGLALLMLDIDRFKHVNDGYGHPAGDRLLQACAQRLTEALDAGDTLARLGGDEFVLLLAGRGDAAAIAEQADRLQRALHAPVTVDGREFHVTVSIGASQFPADGEALHVLLKHADIAMYRAKAVGGDGLQCYSREMSALAVERIELEQALRRALERDEFVLQYQPKVDLARGRLVGVEALVRWQRPVHGLVPPGRFIAVAEDSGLIVPLGEWVLRGACLQAHEWLRQGLRAVPVSVNLSARQFGQDNLFAVVKSALVAAQLDASWLELELTESLAVRGGDAFVERLTALKSLGVKLALDDFGTGYSSLAYLKRFPIDRLKIDKSFVSGLPGSAPDAAIARTVIALGHSLGMKVVAEGVETAAQRDFLRRLRCDEIQGFLVGKPMPSAEFAARLRGAGSRSRAARSAAEKPK